MMKNKIIDKQYIYTESMEFAAEILAKTCKLVMRDAIKQINSPVSHEEYIILETVDLNPGIIQLDLAKKLYIPRSYVGKLILKLEKKGFIRREKGIKGKEKIIMKTYITPEGITAYSMIKDWVLSEISKYSSMELQKADEMIKRIFETVSHLTETYNIKL